MSSSAHETLVHAKVALKKAEKDYAECIKVELAAYVAKENAKEAFVSADRFSTQCIECCDKLETYFKDAEITRMDSNQRRNAASVAAWTARGAHEKAWYEKISASCRVDTARRAVAYARVAFYAARAEEETA
jgi:hypothetical protein